MDAVAAQCAQCVAQSGNPEIERVVVGQADQVHPGVGQCLNGGGRRAEVERLRRPLPTHGRRRQRAFEVHQRQVGAAHQAGHRRQRIVRSAAQDRLLDAAPERDVAAGDQPHDRFTCGVGPVHDAFLPIGAVPSGRHQFGQRPAGVQPLDGLGEQAGAAQHNHFRLHCALLQPEWRNRVGHHDALQRAGA